uniref:Peroxin-19 n=1 Tax=Ascaris suum TaxID=6253 RepID=F1L4Z4_ASCSU
MDGTKEIAEFKENIKEDSNQTESSTIKNTDDELDSLMETMDQEATHKAANNFQEMLEALISVERKALEKTTASNEGEEAEKAEAQQFLKDLVALSENTAKVVRGRSEEEVQQGMAALAPDGKTPIEPLMNVVSTLFSKEMMYPSIKQLYDAFPKYIKEHAEELDEGRRTRYERQINILGKICDEYEKDFDESTATQDEIGKRFQKLSLLMMQLQSYGYPPEELTGSMPDGWQMDATSGVPKLVDVDKAAEACCLM